MREGITHRQRRRASGVIRTFVVASATLAILLVCFAMYQYTQVELPTADEPARPRFPSTRRSLDAPAAGLNPSDNSGVVLGTGKVGPGRDIKLTIYSPEGTEARFEIEVDDWTPKPGAVEEFILVRPRIRMRTRSGHAVRVTADRGDIEAQRHAGGSLDPRRGHLTGNVVIEYDRLTEEQRTARPPVIGDSIDPFEIVRIEMDEIEFDLEYAKVVVPGPVRLDAIDAELNAEDLEIRFNETENRVESLRIAHGGRLLLKPTAGTVDGAQPSMSTPARREVSLVDWLRATIRERIAERQPATGPGKPVARAEGDTPVAEEVATAETHPQVEAEPPTPHVTRRADGVYVFHDVGAKRKSDVEPPVRYSARFEGDVDLVRGDVDTTGSRLQADWLEVRRDVTRQDTQRVRDPNPPPPDGGATSDRKATASEEIVLAWSGRLGVEALAEADDPSEPEDTRTRITAGGAPVRFTSPEGEASCDRLVYFPDGAEVRFEGREDRPARVRSLQQGVLSGVALTMKRVGDAFVGQVEGPGRLEPGPTRAEPSVVRPAPSTPDVGSSTPRPGVDVEPAPIVEASASPADTPVAAPGDVASRSVVTFRDALHVKGRFVRVRRLVFPSLTVRERTVQVVDRAEFRGAVRMSQGDATVESDALTVLFTNRETLKGLEPTVEHLHGEGHVVFVQGEDRLTCREIDVSMATDRRGGIRPTNATAYGDVVVHQGVRSIRARDKLVVEMGVVTDRIAAEVTRAEALSPQRVDASSVVARRVRAYGDVGVDDPGQELELTAAELDCRFTDDGEIETAIVTGTATGPASVRLADFTVVGRKIDLNVPDEWAEVPGEGRLTLRSFKDLDGRRVAEPIPIVVTWTDHLRYRGRENRAVFTGNVHATSETTTTFDCGRLLVEFDDVRREPSVGRQAAAWARQLLPYGKAPGSRDGEGDALPVRVTKEPAYLLASGHAVVLTSEVDPDSGDVLTRARIAGPKLSLNLREDVSKMLIEGSGSLLLEDYRLRTEGPSTATATPNAGGDVGVAGLQGGLLSEGSSGPSTTLIEWHESMWYDFSIDQTRFEGDVELKHFSGAALQRAFGQGTALASAPSGRRTFLQCDILTVDFLDREARRKRGGNQRMGQISTGALRQFDARGSVQLQDDSAGLALWADEVIYERPRQILVIHGSPQRKARIIKSEPGRLPTQVTVVRLIYDLAAGKFQILDPELKGQ